MSKSKKLCPICGETEDEWHVIGGCKKVLELLPPLKTPLKTWNFKHALKIKNKESLKEIGNYISKIRALRNR